MKLLGHPLHPPLTDFPIVLWSVSLLWDAVDFVTGDPIWGRFSFWNITLGLAAAVPTLISGLLDYSKIPDEQAQGLKTATSHMVAMLCTTALFAGSLFVRVAPNIAPATKMLTAFLLSAIGIIVLLVGAWLGGELVFRHGIGRETGK